MKLIHVLFLVLPLATHADTWLSSGEAVIPPAVVVSPDNLGNHTATGTLDLAGNTISNVNRIQAADAGGDLAGPWTLNGSAIGGGGAGDNLGDHVATNTLDLGTNRINVNIEGGMVPWQLGAVLDEGGIYPIPQFRGVRSGSPYAVGLQLAGASNGNTLAYDAAAGAWKPTAAGGVTNSGATVPAYDGFKDYDDGSLVVFSGAVYMMTNGMSALSGSAPDMYPQYWLRLGGGAAVPAYDGFRDYDDGELVSFSGAVYMMTNDMSAVSGSAPDMYPQHWLRVSSGSAGDNLGNHTATQDVDMASHVLTNTAGVIMLAGGYPVGFSGSGDDNGKVGVGIWTPGLSDFVSLIPNYRADGNPAQSGDVLRVTGESFGTKIYHAAPPSGSGSSGNALIGTPGVSPANGEDVYVRAGEVTTAGIDFTGQPGTTFIQGATNGVANKQGAIVMQTHGGESFNALSGGDITIQSGNGGSMGGSNGVIRIIPGFGAPTDKTPRLLMGNKDAGHYVEFDGEQLIMESSGCTIRFVATAGPGPGWMEITQGSITKLAFTNDTILIDGSPVYTGTPGPGQTPVFTKGFCTGVTP